MEIIAAVITLLGTALIALVVRSYRGRIGYEITQLEQLLKVEKGKISLSKERFAEKVVLERIELRNLGYFDLMDVVLHVDTTPIDATCEILKATSLSRAAIELSRADDFLQIKIPNFPRNEQLEVGVSWIGHGGSRYREIRAASGKYKVAPLRHLKAQREGMLWALQSFVLLPILASIGVFMVFDLIGKLK